MAKQKTLEISIPVPDMQVLNVTVTGISPLICHKWSTKAQRQIEDKKGKKAKVAREMCDPEAEFRESLYEIDGRGKYGFPASAFKQAMVDACSFCQGISMKIAKGAFFVMGDLLEIKGSKPKMVTHMVKVPPRKGSADIRYRGQFDEWSITMMIRYNANVVSAEQVLNLLVLAGVSIGIGEMRPGAPMKPGTNGMWVDGGAKRVRKAAK